jgi:hypothetical protein
VALRITPWHITALMNSVSLTSFSTVYPALENKQAGAEYGVLRVAITG